MKFSLIEILPYLLGAPGTGDSIWHLIMNRKKNRAEGDAAEIDAAEAAVGFYKGVFENQEQAFISATNKFIEATQSIADLQIKASQLAEDNARLREENDSQSKQIQNLLKEIKDLRTALSKLQNPEK